MPTCDQIRDRTGPELGSDGETRGNAGDCVRPSEAPETAISGSDFERLSRLAGRVGKGILDRLATRL
jgi:hypothetical protein